MAFIDADKLKEFGFSDKVVPRSPNVVVIVAGLEGTGKTTWALTGPKPLLYQSTDCGDDGVIQKAKGQIIRPAKDYKLDIPHELRPFVDKVKETSNDRQAREGKLANFVHEQFYKPFFDDFMRGIKAGVRTVVWDNALDVWEYTRLSVYGRNATNRSDLQAEANSKYREMVRLANIHHINLIIINHLKVAFESYYGDGGTVKWRPTKDFQMQGFDKAPFLVALNLWLKFTPPDNFEITVKKCRDNPQFVGETFPSMPFHDFMGVLIPSVENWDA